MILAEIAIKVASKAMDKKDAGIAPKAVEEMAKAIKADPVLKNELSLERPYQSRVAIGSVVAALGVVVPLLAKLLGWDVDSSYVVQVLEAVLTLGGALYALYGRFASGLAPLFAR
jgi:hypothetical protein